MTPFAEEYNRGVKERNAQKAMTAEKRKVRRAKVKAALGKAYHGLQRMADNQRRAHDTPILKAKPASKPRKGGKKPPRKGGGIASPFGNMWDDYPEG